MFHWTWNKEDGKKILSFSSWTLLGCTSNTATQQGISLLFNNYVGLVANTALGFANQVNTALGRFVSSFTTAFNPQIIKFYAERNYNAMFILMNRASKFSFTLCYIMALPLIINMDFILRLWLVTVPEYTVKFCQLIVVCTVIDSTTSVFNTAITATGQVRKYQISISLSFLLDLVCAWLLLLLGVHPALVFCSRIFTRGGLNMLIGFYYSYRQLKFNLCCYSREVLLPLLLTLCITIPTGLLFASIPNGWLRLLLTSSVCLLITSLCFYFIIMNKVERKQVAVFIKDKFINGRDKIAL
jgi:O-antigen/teichoic acid export membrane protein